MPDASRLLLAGLALAANPLLFYALEYWEHAPAVALLAGGTAAVAAARSGGSRLAVAGGALVGAGVLLRPEGLWYAAGLLFTLARPHWLAFGSGAAFPLLAFGGANLLHFGNPLGAHASAVLAPIGVGFGPARWNRVQEWLWPASVLEWAGLLLVAAAWTPVPFARDLRTRQLTALIGATVVAILAAQGVMPDRAFLQGFPRGAARLRACRLGPGGRSLPVRPGVRRDRRRGAHRHQRRRRAVGHPLSADCRAAAAPAGGARRHRRDGRGAVASTARGGRAPRSAWPAR